ncbi:MAG: hypothetical protein C0504_15490 [Candidatus Solibacter sp.]|nr:hypothetical protein [Candidatus Solibacter sp.]
MLLQGRRWALYIERTFTRHPQSCFVQADLTLQSGHVLFVRLYVGEFLRIESSFGECQGVGVCYGHFYRIPSERFSVGSLAGRASYAFSTEAL